MIQIQDKKNYKSYQGNWINESYLKIITNPSEIKLVKFFQIKQVVLSIENISYKMFHYEKKKIFVFPFHWESHFVKLSLPEKLLNEYIEKVDIGEYLS